MPAQNSEPNMSQDSETLLGGSWVVVSRVISRITIVITHIG